MLLQSFLGLTFFPISCISRIFLKYLNHYVLSFDGQVEVYYTSADDEARQYRLASSDTPVESTESDYSRIDEDKDLDSRDKFHVLTPAFYSRLVSYKTFSDVVQSEILTVDENQTAQMSGIGSGQLYQILTRGATNGPYDTTERKLPATMSFSDKLIWSLVCFLRCDPMPASYPDLNAQTHNDKHIQDEEGIAGSAKSSLLTSWLNTRLTFLDNFVQKHCSKNEKRKYQAALIAVFLEKRLLGVDVLAVLRRWSLVIAPLLIVLLLLRGRVGPLL